MKISPVFVVLLLVVVAGGTFFGGMQYQKSQTSSGVSQLSAGQGRRFVTSGQGGQNANFRPVTGQITSADTNSITVQMQDGSSKIVLLSASTRITEATSAGTQDLTTGKDVLVTGSTNSDGSVTAQNIQINPQLRTNQNPQNSGPGM